MESSEECCAPCATTITLTISGVRKIPSKLDAEALQIAAGTLPRATDVKAIEDCTVDGNTHRNKMPRYKSGVMSNNNAGLSNRPSKGNTANVHTSTVRCKRQCTIPAITAWRESLAPCMKNSRPIMRVVSQSKTTAVEPVQGRKLAVRTTANNISVRLSGKKRGRAMAVSVGRKLPCCNTAKRQWAKPAILRHSAPYPTALPDPEH